MSEGFGVRAPATNLTWLQKFASDINGLFRRIMPAPLRVKDYATADLPAAADFKQGFVWDSTTSNPKVSNGTTWLTLVDIATSPTWTGTHTFGADNLRISGASGSARFLRWQTAGVSVSYIALGTDNVTMFYNAPTGGAHTFQINTVTQASVSAAGLSAVTAFIAPDGSVTAGGANGIYFTGDSGTGFASNGSNLAIRESGVIGANLSNTGKEFRLASDYKLSWSSATNNNSANDTYIERSAANTVRTSGGLVVQGLLDASGASAGQIKFPATQNASSDANTLDDYEEGTYTPTVTAGAGSFTSVTATGRYVKIGKLVFVRIKVTITTNGTANSFWSVTAPFTSANVASNDMQALSVREVVVAGYSSSAAVQNNSTTIFVQKYDGTYLGADGYVVCISGCYEV